MAEMVNKADDEDALDENVMEENASDEDDAFDDDETEITTDVSDEDVSDDNAAAEQAAAPQKFASIFPPDFPIKTPSTPFIARFRKCNADQNKCAKSKSWRRGRARTSTPVPPYILAKFELTILALALGYLWRSMEESRSHRPITATIISMFLIVFLPAAQEQPTNTNSATDEQKASSKPKNERPTEEEIALKKAAADKAPQKKAAAEEE